MRMTTPSPTTFESTSRSGFLSLVTPKRRFPVPSTTGNTISRSSSTRSCSKSVCTSRGLPWTTISPSCSCFSFATSSATSHLSTVELPHSGSSRVEETTYLGMVLNLSANSPSLDGQAFAKPSYVTRPSSRASEESVSSSLNLSPSSPRLTSKLQPPYLKSAVIAVASTTLFNDMHSLTAILPPLAESRSSVPHHP